MTPEQQIEIARLSVAIGKILPGWDFELTLTCGEESIEISSNGDAFRDTD